MTYNAVSLAMKVGAKVNHKTGNWNDHFPRDYSRFDSLSKEHIEGLRKGLTFREKMKLVDGCSDAEMFSLFVSYNTDIIYFENLR